MRTDFAILLTIFVGNMLASPEELCAKYSSEERCEICYASLSKDKGCLAPPAPTKNCLQYNEDFSCAVCVYGYKLAGVACEAIDKSENCILFGQNRCSLCRKGILLSWGDCEPAKTCKLLNCAYCVSFQGGNEYCARCAKGFVGVMKKDMKMDCVLREAKDAGCLMNDEQNTCLECETNFYLKAGKCLKSGEYHFELDWMDEVTESSDRKVKAESI